MLSGKCLSETLVHGKKSFLMFVLAWIVLADTITSLFICKAKLQLHIIKNPGLISFHSAGLLEQAEYRETCSVSKHFFITIPFSLNRASLLASNKKEFSFLLNNSAAFQVDAPNPSFIASGAIYATCHCLTSHKWAGCLGEPGLALGVQWNYPENAEIQVVNSSHLRELQG